MKIEAGDLLRKSSGYLASRNVVALVTDLRFDKPTNSYVVVYELYGDIEYAGQSSSMMKDIFTTLYQHI